ncbi:MAG: radical SAM protein [Deltaproteobacteria bacterium]|nr:radical SAM protein [Deltaproteobacteria bacterium]
MTEAPLLSRRKALLKLTYRCNNNCAFCHAAPHRGAEAAPGTLERKIRRAAALGADMVVLSGGEPTVHPRWLELAGLVAAQGMRLGLVTNGRMLSYPGLVDRLLAHGLDYAYLSLTGPDAALHDRHVRAPAFRQTWAALTALAGRVPLVTANVVVTRWNIGRLDDIVRAVDRLPAVRLKFSAVEPAGNVLDDFDGLVPRLERTARAVRAAMRRARASVPGRSVAWDGLPLCLMGGEEDGECALREDGFAFLCEVFERDWFPVDDRHRGFAAPCAGCSLRRRCRGVFGEYLARRDAAELRPVSRPVPNSLNWAPAAAEERLSLRACPVRAGRRAPPDPVRGIFVRTGPGRVRRHEAATRDFSDETLRTATRVQEQVYLEPSGAVLVTDFARELRRLRLAPTCRPCPARPLCGGVFERAPGASFRRARELLARILRSLSGSVLDVGCGLAPYRAALEPAVRAGRLRYTGIDPGGGAARPAPGFEFVRGTLEGFRPRGAKFDTVMALRSFNHLRDARRAMAKLAALAAPGGRVVLAEDVVFGVVRPPGGLEPVLVRDDLPWEHRLNPSVEEAALLARGAGLCEASRAGTERTDSTLWVLVLERGDG